MCGVLFLRYLYGALLMIALLIWLLASEPATVPNLASMSIPCPASAVDYVEAAIWIGRPISRQEGPRFEPQCLYCPVQDGCQEQSVYWQLDKVKYRWVRINASCFPTQAASESVSVLELYPRLVVAEDGGGCSQ